MFIGGKNFTAVDVLTVSFGVILCAVMAAFPALAQNHKQRQPIGRYIYYCEGGAKIVKDLFQNTKTGEYQVVLGLPNGNTVALNQRQETEKMVFTDDIQARWTLNGNNAILELWAFEKGWYTRFKSCEYSTARQ